MTTIIASVGYPCSGKSTVSKWMKEQNFDVVSMGDILRKRFEKADSETLRREFEYQDKSSLLGKWATSQRDMYGNGIVANWTCQYIESNINSDIVFIDGLRSKEEYCIFNNRFENVEIIYIKSELEERLTRIQERGREGECSFTKEDLRKRDEREEEWGLDQIIDEADYIINNNGGIEELYQQVEDILYTEQAECLETE